MNCPRCGTPNLPQSQTCGQCGANLFADAANPYASPFAGSVPPPSAADDAALRLIIPIGTSGWAIASGYLGLLSLSCVCGILGVPAIITGLVALKKINANPKLGGKVRAIVGIVFGVVGLLGFVMVILGSVLGHTR